MSQPFNTLLPSPPQQPPNSVQTHIQILHRRTKREPDKMVTWRIEEVSTVRRVDVEEYPRDHDRFLFEELFEEGLFFLCGKKTSAWVSLSCGGY